MLTLIWEGGLGTESEIPRPLNIPDVLFGVEFLNYRYPIDYRIDLVRLSEQSAPLPRSFPVSIKIGWDGYE